MSRRPKFDAACAAWRADPLRTVTEVAAVAGCGRQMAWKALAWLREQGEIGERHSRRTTAILADPGFATAQPDDLAERHGVDPSYIYHLRRRKREQERARRLIEKR